MVVDERDGLLIIQFAKSPVPGRVKTRMLPTLDAQQACDLHIELLQWTCRILCRADLGAVELQVAGPVDSPAIQACNGFGLDAIGGQYGNDLGERMYRAIDEGLSRYRKVILVGSDCPALDRAYLRQASAVLDSHQVVIGPAEDGGYVLIGATAISAEYFNGIVWGQNRVFADTVRLLDGAGCHWQCLPVLPDVDRPEDLPGWRALQESEQR
ncbi:MAG: TIGR04282 family arsenosugar biosynthesis glycosyltransferase [Halioglobus sp.]